NWVQWSDQASKLFRAIAHDKKLPRTSHKHGHPREQTAGGVAASRSQGGGSGSPQPSPSGTGHAGTSAASGGTPGPHSPLSGVTKRYGGITAGANVCRDTSAFAGPLGGH
ncbi:MAG: hypothetical protein ACTHJW_05070, partial [Streptosporangiaceae bacterium]